jgi:hypothetical protein
LTETEGRVGVDRHLLVLLRSVEHVYDALLNMTNILYDRNESQVTV